MTIPELAEAATEEGTVVLTEDEAISIAETYQDACERCHVLTKELAARDREMAAVREQLHNALYPKAEGQ